jgi:small multidrug resistance pump
MVIGLAVYIIAALCYVLALNKIPVSIAFPSVAASYAVTAVLAHVLWDEPLGWPQLIGILLIGGGVLLIHQHGRVDFAKKTANFGDNAVYRIVR